MAKTAKKPASPKTTGGSGPLVTAEQAERYIFVQGAVINAANLLQDAFFELFLVALSLERAEAAASGGTIRFREQALHIWHSVNADSAQRDMALAAISHIPTKLNLQPAFRRLDRIQQWLRPLLSTGRHDLAHNPILFHKAQNDPPLWVPVIGGLGTRPSSRRRYDLLREVKVWEDIAHDLNTLAIVVLDINKQIQRLDVISRDPHFRGRIRVSWPRKPRLRSPSLLKEISDLLSQRGEKTQKQRSRPKPFWA